MSFVTVAGEADTEKVTESFCEINSNEMRIKFCGETLLINYTCLKINIWCMEQSHC
jgi:hypothetical protein